MKTRTVTLVAATSQIIASGDVGKRTIYVFSALTDVFLGGSDVNSTTTGMAFADCDPGVPIEVGATDLYAISATGGAVKVMDPQL